MKPVDTPDGYYLVRADRQEHRYRCAGQADPTRSSAWTTNIQAAVLFARVVDALAVQGRLMKDMPVRPISSKLCEDHARRTDPVVHAANTAALQAADVDAGFQAVKELMAAAGCPTDLLVHLPDDTEGWTFVSDDFPMEWSTNHPTDSGENDDAIEVEACTWGECKRDCLNELRRQKKDRDTTFVNDIVAAIPLDFANAVDGNGDPVGWED